MKAVSQRAMSLVKGVFCNNIWSFRDPSHQVLQRRPLWCSIMIPKGSHVYRKDLNRTSTPKGSYVLWDVFVNFLQNQKCLIHVRPLRGRCYLICCFAINIWSLRDQVQIIYNARTPAATTSLVTIIIPSQCPYLRTLPFGILRADGQDTQVPAWNQEQKLLIINF